MNAPRTKRWRTILLGQALVTLLIAVIGGGLVFYSQGYRINWTNMSVYKTGVILIGVSPRADRIIVNNDEYKNTSFVSKEAVSGIYNVRVEKEGYSSWEGRVRVIPEVLYDLRDIKLFRLNPTVVEMTDQKKIEYLNLPTDVLVLNAEKGLTFGEYEIWLDNVLITRFSEPISGVSWFYDMDHIMFQIGDEIRIIDKSGYNSATLATLSSDAKTKFAVGGRGKELYFYDNEKYYMAVIR